jgi:hypothetical protein
VQDFLAHGRFAVVLCDALSAMLGGNLTEAIREGDVAVGNEGKNNLVRMEENWRQSMI